MSLNLYIGYLNNILKHVDGYKPLQLTNSLNLSEVLNTARDIDDLSFLDNLLAYGESELYFLKSYGFLYDPISTDALSRIKNSGKSPELVESIIENLGDLADEDFNLDPTSLTTSGIGNTFDSITNQFQEEYINNGVLESFSTFQDEDDLAEEEELQRQEELEELEDSLGVDLEGYDFDDEDEEEDADEEEIEYEDNFDYFANAEDEDEEEELEYEDNLEQEDNFDYFANSEDDDEDDDDWDDEEELEDEDNFDYFSKADEDNEDEYEDEEDNVIDSDSEGVDEEHQRQLTQSDFIDDEYALLMEDDDEDYEDDSEQDFEENNNYPMNMDDEEDEEEDWEDNNYPMNMDDEEDEEEDWEDNNYPMNMDDEEDEEEDWEDNNNYPMDMDDEEDEYPMEDEEDEEEDWEDNNNYPMDMDDEEDEYPMEDDEDEDFPDETSPNNRNNTNNSGEFQNNGEQDLGSIRTTNNLFNSGGNPSSVPVKTSNDKLAESIVGFSEFILGTPSKAKKGLNKVTKVAKAMKVEEDEDEFNSQK